MELYLAICNETNNSKVFISYEDFKEFAVKERYAYSYFKLGDAVEIADVDLYYYE
jgi:hypothetical protein